MLLRLSSVDPGVNLQNVLTSRMAVSPSILGDPARVRAAWQAVIDRGHRVPGVRAIAMVDTVPMREGNNQVGYWPAPPEPERMQKPLALANSVTPDYLDVMGIPLRRGRFFDDHDRLGSEPVVVIDEVLAQRAFAGRIHSASSLDRPRARAASSSASSAMCAMGTGGRRSRAGARPALLPVRPGSGCQRARWSELMSIAVRTGVEPLSLVETLRHELRGPGGDQALYATATLEQLANATLAEQRFLVVLFGAFAALAMTLACIGIYGVLAYLTANASPNSGCGWRWARRRVMWCGWCSAKARG